MSTVRLQKFLADAGVASRRASEKLILRGVVTVNGRVVIELGSKVDPLHDAVSVEGAPVRTRKKLYIALNKPPGFICTRIDPETRRVVSHLLPAEWSNLFTVGRLDRDSQGLIFLTNDGDFSLKLTHPRYGVHKKYVAVVEGRLESSQLNRFTQGVEHEGEMLKAERIRLVDANNSHSVVELELAQRPCAPRPRRDGEFLDSCLEPTPTQQRCGSCWHRPIEYVRPSAFHPRAQLPE